MTRIDFYRYAEDKLHVACRLAAKALAQKKRVVVYDPEPSRLAEFDKRLWTWQAVGFVPHVFANSPLAGETPVILTSSGEALPHHDVLINLADEWPPFFATFERVLEIVGAGDDDKAKARARHAFYKDRGYDIQVRDIEG